MLKFCSLVSGSSGNSYVFSNGKARFLVDAGLSGKQIEQRLEQIKVDPRSLSGIFLTHEHGDHVKGVGVLSRRYNIPLYANKETWKGMGDRIGKIEGTNQRYFVTGETVDHFSTGVRSFKTSHDARESVGFTIENSYGKISIATDTGNMSEEIYKELEGSNLVIIEANHDVEVLKSGRYPYHLKRRILSDLGHLSNESAGECIVRLAKGGVRNFVLAHLSEENNFPELALTTVNEMVEKHCKEIKEEIFIDIAFRDRISRVYELNKGL